MAGKTKKSDVESLLCDNSVSVGIVPLNEHGTLGAVLFRYKANGEGTLDRTEIGKNSGEKPVNHKENLQ